MASLGKRSLLLGVVTADLPMRTGPRASRHYVPSGGSGQLSEVPLQPGGRHVDWPLAAMNRSCRYMLLS
jgi:hypothetical protein